MLRKLSLVTASLAASVFVIVTIAHACADLSAKSMAAQHNGTTMEASDSLPCHKKTNDLCESVRHSLLSVKPTEPVAVSLLDPLLSISVVLAVPQTFLPNLAPVTFHPVFKVPLSFSYLVLRI